MGSGKRGILKAILAIVFGIIVVAFIKNTEGPKADIPITETKEQVEVMQPETKEQVEVMQPESKEQVEVMQPETKEQVEVVPPESQESFQYDEVPLYNQEAYVILHGNRPYFTQEDILSFPEEYYSKQDEYGRCNVAMAIISMQSMPTKPRGEIGNIKPSGWHTVKYNDLIEGNYLYNRCHLIGYQLAGENDNADNLITGTRYFNIEGMLPFENQIADYVKRTNGSVLYRVTPVFVGQDLVARGVLLEAMSLADLGEALSICSFVYNVQPGVVIDYATGDSRLKVSGSGIVKEAAPIVEEDGNSLSDKEQETKYILNINTHKFHIPSCDSVKDMKEKNKRFSMEDREEIIAEGFEPCKRCNP